MMKEFLKRLFLFVITFLFLGSVAVFVSKKWVSKKELYLLPSTIHALILGHSQPECSLNDTLIPNTKNLAQGGEAYFYTYQKIKKLLPINPQIKTVYVSFSNNQIEKRMDEWTYDDEHLGNYFPKYAAHMNTDDYLFLVKNNYKAVLLGEIKAIKNNVGFLAKGKTNYLENNNWGGFLYLKRNKLDSLIKINYIQQIKNETSDEVSTINLNYLEKIVRYCQSKNVDVVFYRTPIHPVLFSVYNENKFQKIRQTKFATIPFYDFHNFPMENNEMGDFDHLNFNGATKFSLHFKSYINGRNKMQTNKNI